MKINNENEKQNFLDYHIKEKDIGCYAQRIVKSYMEILKDKTNKIIEYKYKMEG